MTQSSAASMYESKFSFRQEAYVATVRKGGQLPQLALIGAVTVRRYTLAGSGEELLRRIKEEYVPIITALPGFKAYHVVDCGGRETMSISFWENKTEALRASEAARDWISKSAFGLVPFPPERLQGDTVLDIVAS